MASKPRKNSSQKKKASAPRSEKIVKRVAIDPFGDFPPVIGSLPPQELASRLSAAGDTSTALLLSNQIKTMGSGGSRFHWPWKPGKIPAWKYTDHAFGFFGKNGSTAGAVDLSIKDARNLRPDKSLKGANIKITLDRLRVFEYPGSGIHTILFDFYAQHQTAAPGEAQDLHFSQSYRAQQGAGAGITGYPVFVGLKVGDQGVSFKCYTVNVSNENDKKLLGFLDGDVFKKGLSLINSVNPAIPVVSGFATGLIKAFAGRHENAPVQDFYMGLDFSGIPTRAQMSEGSYVAVQVEDATKWDWSEWIYKTSTGQIVSKQDPETSIPLNYIEFSVSKM
jgi:hypothetical protein